MQEQNIKMKLFQKIRIVQKKAIIFLVYFLIIIPFINHVNAQESMQRYPEIKTDTNESGGSNEDINTEIEENIRTKQEPWDAYPSDENTRNKSPLEGHPREEQSSIEKMFNTWSDKPLQQFGYSFFDKAVVKGLLPVGDEYTVGPGDTVAMYFWGDPVDILNLKGFYTLAIDRDGKIFIPNLGVFYVWGLDVSQTKEIIYRAMAKKFKQFEIEVTLGKLREFPVYVSGYVKQPGVVLATGVYNVLDVLAAAGGVEKNGSLRNIVIKRARKDKIEETKIDLYDLLIHGNPVNIKVGEGDSVFVNPIGKTSGMSGVVKRPAIYELTPYSSIEDLIDLSGGILPSAYSVGIKLIRYEYDTLNIYEGNLKEIRFLKKPLNDGDLILIEPLY
ncbi:hypothetical protein LCGC14_2153010, partial [marine sediment metagenome]